MMLPKFIITMDGKFRLGMVNQHKDLLNRRTKQEQSRACSDYALQGGGRPEVKPGEQCIGGGYYHFDYVSNRIVLDRSSYDFGKPKWHLLDTLRVPSTYRGMRLVYVYDDGFHDDFNVSEELNIKYYD